MWDDYLNPYYDADKLDLEILCFDEPGLSYEYNTLLFFSTKDGRVYTARDCGCSCPTPFEYFSGKTQDDVLQKLERVGSLRQANSILDSWNKNYDGQPHISNANDQLMNWWIEHFKN